MAALWERVRATPPAGCMLQSTPPIIQGTIDPPATVLKLPHLRTRSPPQIGTTWTLDTLDHRTRQQLIGLSLWAQGIAVPQVLAPRLTNAVAAMVQ